MFALSCGSPEPVVRVANNFAARRNRPSPVGEGAATRRMRRLIRYCFSRSENLPKHTQ